MIILKNGKRLCECDTDNFIYRKCDICGEEVERCTDCHLVKASDCEHYDVSQGRDHLAEKIATGLAEAKSEGRGS